MAEIKLRPIGFVTNARTEKSDKNWSSIESIIELTAEFTPESLAGIEDFSHLEILYHFHQSKKEFKDSEHPRGDRQYPKVGIFAQRKKDRPNRLGATIVNLVRVDGKKLVVSNLDAISGTPILDIKPVFQEYLPQSPVRQPAWTHELMKEYW